MSTGAGVHPIANNRLPTDILLCILHYCDFRTIIQFSTTCKKSQIIVRQSTSLQLCVELDVNGLEIVKQSLKAGVTHAVILEELKGYRDAWLRFRFGPPLQRPATNPIMPPRPGQCHGEAYFEPFCAPGVGEDTNKRCQFNRIQVTSFRPPTNSNPPLDFKRTFKTFSVDPKQDLIVLIEYEDASFTRVDIHLNHLSTTKPHSLAQYHTLTVRFEELDEGQGFYYGGTWIMGHILLARFTPASQKNRSNCDNIAIWNWQSGLFLGRILSGTNNTIPTFFDKNHLLFFSYTSGSSSSAKLVQSQPALLVYRIPTSITVSAQEPLIADCYMPSCPSLRPTLTLEFPRLDPKYRVSRSVLWDTLARPGDLAYQRSAQVAHSDIKTVALSLWMAEKRPSKNGKVIPTLYSIFVSTDSILDHLSENRSEETATIIWSDWGAAATRWFADDRDCSNIAKIHGSSHLVIVYNPLRKNKIQITSCTREFNSQIIKRHTCDALDQNEREKVSRGKSLTFGDKSDDIRIVGRDTKTVVHTGFEQPVESTLPYMVVDRARSKLPFTGWYMHSDYLVEVTSIGSFLSLYQLDF
ncbi:similar to Ubiquitin associated and SH3 domain-containing protein B (Suppressor of T-cell receptor signaling 1) (STS-1) (Cbl-interacting protein p70) [Rhizoctonia solani]|uniref:Similar to Ubiquitin associated and SH3 domain-containing protein B (Suppressor of T-cell receptor signaling 1) (STS-1) (Cbl-interacting protein p70) n=1 Tax=Rhizoctonia solani TaxID=456999 RepID=A0A0K6GIU8_9AGAM|nr:similar to Ubiquitin associated and SH3 domain-containing protein B (Suppressor of T-cell receptor signaling 1) (STS-1) (Cbl-interacting protein p70) [Rhizoctonia solani]